jgi:hypothetical protein
MSTRLYDVTSQKGVLLIKLFVMQFPPFSCSARPFSTALGANILLSISSEISSVCIAL